MKYFIPISLLGFSLGALTANGAVVFSDAFSYPDGALVGQGGWVQNATTATNPIQVAAGAANIIANSGQDAYVNFAAAITNTDATFAYYGATVTVTSATATGEYFLHFTNGTTNPTAFSGRLAAQSSGAGFVLGYSESTNAGTNYGTTVLTLNTPYNVVVRYGFVSGTLNDTGAVFVSSGAFDPVEANNTPYLTDAFNGTTAEIGNFTGIQIRQGVNTASAAVTLDNLVVSTTFSESAIPEPSVALLALFAGLTAMRRQR